ncbi:hypothetical protein FOCC_FOCC012032 [Frankliniella occidentalis]|nr:hypothetical protein FOCC_FOCC012032 [Frankliniella occidentalis]
MIICQACSRDTRFCSPAGPRRDSACSGLGSRGQLDQLMAAALPTTPLDSYAVLAHEAVHQRALAAEGLARPRLGV